MRRKACCLILTVLLVGCTTKSSEPRHVDQGSGDLLRVNQREESEANLREIGRTYSLALRTAPPKSVADLKVHVEQADKLFVSPRDQQPYEIVWGVDPARLADPATETLLAWEQTADPDGSRCVLLADCRTVVYMNEELFKRTTKAKGR